MKATLILRYILQTPQLDEEDMWEEDSAEIFNIQQEELTEIKLPNIA